MDQPAYEPSRKGSDIELISSLLKMYCLRLRGHQITTTSDIRAEDIKCLNDDI